MNTIDFNTIDGYILIKRSNFYEETRTAYIRLGIFVRSKFFVMYCKKFSRNSNVDAKHPYQTLELQMGSAINNAQGER